MPTKNAAKMLCVRCVCVCMCVYLCVCVIITSNYNQQIVHGTVRRKCLFFIAFFLYMPCSCSCSLCIVSLRIRTLLIGNSIQANHSIHSIFELQCVRVFANARLFRQTNIALIVDGSETEPIIWPH